MKQLLLLFSICIFLFSYGFDDSGLSNGSSGTGACPTTTACGCYGHNKAECQDDICCEWTVGEGYDCR